MDLFMPNPNDEVELTLSQEIILLSDSFTEFSKVNAFLSEAFTSVMSIDEPVKDEVLQGAKYCAESIQSKSHEIKAAIERLRERSIEIDG